MVSTFAAFGFVALCLAFAALQLFTFLNSLCGAATGTGTTTCADYEAPPLLLHSAAEVFPPLAAVAVLFFVVTLTYRHLMSRDAAGAPVAGAAGNGRRRSILGHGTMFALCVSAGTLQFILFGGQAAVGGGGGAGRHGGALACTLGLAALRALPAAATLTFFSGMVLIVAGVVRVRPGGGGEAGGAGAVAEDGPVIQALLRFLTKEALGAAAALVGLMFMALTLYGAKY